MLSFDGWKDPGCRERSRVGSVPACDWAHYCLCQACAKQCVASWGSVIHSVAFHIPLAWQISCTGTNSHPVVLQILLLQLSFAGHSHRSPSLGCSPHAQDRPGVAQVSLHHSLSSGMSASSSGVPPASQIIILYPR